MKLFLFLLLATNLIVTTKALGNDIPSQSIPSNALVTASEYCDFLNAIVLFNDPNLYDAKMGSDALTGSIIKLEQNHCYHYLMIAGRENMPVRYVNEQAKQCYYEWTQKKTFNNEKNDKIFEAPSVLFHDSTDSLRNDLTLRSNQQLFEIEIPSFHFSLNLRNAFSQTKNLCSNKGALLVSIATVVGLMIADAVIRNEEERTPQNLKLEDFEIIADEASLGEHEPITIVHESDSVSLRRLAPPAIAEGVTAPPINHDGVINAFITALEEHALHFSEELKKQANDHGLTRNIMRQVFERIKKNHFINQLLSVEKIPIDQELHTCLKLLKKEGNVFLPEIIVVGDVVVPILKSPLHQISIKWNEWEQHFSLDDTHPLSAHFSPIIETLNTLES